MCKHNKRVNVAFKYELGLLVRVELFGKLTSSAGVSHNVKLCTSIHWWFDDKEVAEMLALWEALDIADAVGWELMNSHVC